METLLGKHWHHMPSEEAVDLLDSSLDRGLDSFEVEARQEHFGPNALKARTQRGLLVRFLLQFHQPLVYILLAAGITTGLVTEWSDAGAIFAVVLVNAVIGFIQESKAAGAIDALARSLTMSATVVRAGESRRIDASGLVPGDIVLLQSGDKVPADLRLALSRDLKIDESVLTGESVPVDKVSESLERDTVLADRRNMAFASTLVTYGQGRGVVVATGDRTEMGRISRMISEAQDLETPLTKRIAYFSRILLMAILALGCLTFIAGLLRGKPVVEMFMAAVALTVGAIPEGLPAAVTIILAVGVSRMARRRAIIRRLPAVETLGSTTVICSDKTGTLTENQMTVRRLSAGQNLYRIEGAGYDLFGRIVAVKGSADCDGSGTLLETLRAGLLCNDSVLTNGGDGSWKVGGDPTEGALLVSARKGGLSEESERTHFPRLDTIPFESEHQYMATLHGLPDNVKRRAYLKGAVETVLSRCSSALDNSGHLMPLDEGAIRRAAEAMASEGLRVLGFARIELPSPAERITHDDVATGLTFLGLQGMIDPPKPEAIQAVAACRGAGVQVKMITGDHALTAAAIARQVGIMDGSEESDEPPAVVTGKEMIDLSDEELMASVKNCHVFARVAPEQKLRLVKALQTQGHVVAMTGDGVNDAPALKQADIGIAMGITGTEVAKEASDMILTDDNFASIEAAVEEGRSVFDNLLKFIVWAVPTNLGQGLVILTAVFAGIELPILPVQALWINMTTAGSLGLMLAFEPKEPGLMTRLPRDPRGALLSGDLWMRITMVGVLLMLASFGLFEWEEWSRATVVEARTVAVNAFAAISSLYLLNCRSLRQSLIRIGPFRNPWIWGGLILMTIFQLGFTYLPLMNSLFHTAPLGLWSWLRILAIALAVNLLVAVEKRLRRHSGNAAREANP